ncbi:MAG TPA: 2-dehydropantoate 2-reductase [Terriglobales bacterium]|nr:2-dehydropantoate 2-reductase [Terriglobales bacterium]
MRVCIVGCGALGSVIAAHLARLPDVEVYAYDISEAHIAAIRESGLHLSGAAEFTAHLHATTNPKEIPPCDFGIVATKSLHTQNAMEQTCHIFGGESAVCSVQNGLGNEDMIAKHVRYVIRGVTTMGVHLAGHGHAVFEFYSNLWIGPFEPSHTPYKLVQRLAELMQRSGLRVIPLEDARGAQWTKLIFNSAVNPVGALTRLHHRAATGLEATNYLYEALLDEGKLVAAALGIELLGNLHEMIAEGARAPGKRKVSMLQDVLAHRPTEVDFINGAIADQGEKMGVPVPLNRAVWQLMKGLERSWVDPD